MRPLTQKARAAIADDPFYERCARSGPDCKGRLTIEHAFTYAGKQIDDAFNLVPLCEFHHGLIDAHRGGLDKRRNEYIALCRAKQSDLDKYPKKDWETILGALRAVYGDDKSR